MSQLLHRVCPVCGKQDAKPFLKKGAFQLVQCAACRMIYTNPVTANVATGAFYDDSGEEYLAADKLTSDYSPVRFDRELRIFRTHCPRGSVLDVGCSSGGFLYQLNRRYPGDYEVLGTDVAKAPLTHAAEMGVPVLAGDFLNHPFEKKFDAVTFWAVVEHLFQPDLFLKKAASILKPGGLCFVLVPNMESLAFRVLGAKYRYIFTEHINYFSQATLRQFVGHEFEILRVKSTHFNPLVILNDFRRGAREVPRAERAQLLKRTTGYKQSKWMMPVRLAYQASEALLDKCLMADNLVIVGRKRP